MSHKVSSTIMAALSGLSQANAQTWQPKLDGEFTLQIDFSETEGVKLGLLDLNTNQLVDLGQTTIQITAASKRDSATGSNWDPLGRTYSSQYWALEQEKDPNIVWLGAKSDIQINEITPLWKSNSSSLQVSIYLQLVTVRGSGPNAGGHFSVYSLDQNDEPIFHISTVDGIYCNDSLDQVFDGQTAYLNWAFTEAGDYFVTFYAYGVQDGEAVPMGALSTFHFQVLPDKTNPQSNPMVENRLGTPSLVWDDERVLYHNANGVMRSNDMQRWWVHRGVANPYTGDGYEKYTFIENPQEIAVLDNEPISGSTMTGGFSLPSEIFFTGETAYSSSNQSSPGVGLPLLSFNEGTSDPSRSQTCFGKLPSEVTFINEDPAHNQQTGSQSISKAISFWRFDGGITEDESASETD